MDRDKKYYLIREDILPEAILKTAQAKEFLASGSVDSIKEAVEKADLARSTFYKYKDGVHPFFDGQTMKIINLSLYLRHQPGVLFQVLDSIAQVGINVLTVNQNLPLQGMANVTLSLEMEKAQVSGEELVGKLSALDGVTKVEFIGRS